MHPNPAFRQAPAADSLALVRERSFGTLVLNGDGVPMLSHVPFQLSQDAASVELHLTRSNPIARAVAQAAPAVIAVAGPDGYVSPDWYGIDDQVPTWNYVAVHLVGRLQRLPDAEMAPMLARLSAHFEARLAPKPEWTLDKLPAEGLARFLRMIVPFRFAVEEVRSTWKLGQNKAPAVRLAAAAEVAGGVGQELEALAARMRQPPG